MTTDLYWPVYRLPDENDQWGHTAITEPEDDRRGHSLSQARDWLRREIERDAHRGAAEDDPIRYAVILAIIPEFVPGQIVRLGQYEYTILEESP